jgi:hypothetical protein
MDWKTVSDKIVQDDQNKWDRKVSGEQLSVGLSFRAVRCAAERAHLVPSFDSLATRTQHNTNKIASNKPCMQAGLSWIGSGIRKVLMLYLLLQKKGPSVSTPAPLACTGFI